jgi:peptide/nickel transport system permease protein
MSDNMDKTPRDVFDAHIGPTRINAVPDAANADKARKIADDFAENNRSDAERSSAASDANGMGAGADGSENLSLSDDRRVKVLSPGAMVAKRFFRNRLAVTGLTVLVIMFLFSFLGGAISPYDEAQIFYAEEHIVKDYAGAVENTEFRYAAKDKSVFSGAVQAQAFLAISKGSESYTYKNVTYGVINEGKDFYSITLDGEIIGIAYKDILSPIEKDTSFSFDFNYNSLKAYTQLVSANEALEDSAQDGVIGEYSEFAAFTSDGIEYKVDVDGNVFNDENVAVAYISRYSINSVMADAFLTRQFKNQVVDAIDSANEQGIKETEFSYVNENGDETSYQLVFSARDNIWYIKHSVLTTVISDYEAPSSKHWFGTDRNGMDMLTRLMYGGRVSLVIGFIVVLIATVLGVIFGGISGYFGGWVDNLIMRIVDIFYCIPSTPILIILGAMMDAQNVDPQLRMLYLMLILGFLGWPGTARLVRGQILSLREQEFMTATEACGVRVSRRIFRHLIPNVIPQLIVTCTMSLGSTIITEATLSFLGLGVRFPFASWGNIINDVNDTYVLTNFWFIWIPAGVCLLLTVLAFNLVGDGLRDAFDPKMKR